ncbi:hypothetical protein [Tsukamurella paurometabola]|uniref:Uncharacterized protein n=1 Tax=Tsukamurella paurometabola TaxID=2061 RepID=A0A3P8MBS3_TSUPA|nr:hypothetical protein [Tsukamurella paurometabola]MBS4100316.1 hypothetical protein [Tsukamurella paurometabola]UEA82674.1 hypothetical protein LK411_20270 [Tsukamurella paurometabola]VDR39740.1 Uncharacterised protein [Tsukamurella paurometabola]
MQQSNDPRIRDLGIGVPHADPADLAEQARSVDLDAVIEDYPWVRRDEVLTIDGRRFFI